MERGAAVDASSKADVRFSIRSMESLSSSEQMPASVEIRILHIMPEWGKYVFVDDNPLVVISRRRFPHREHSPLLDAVTQIWRFSVSTTSFASALPWNAVTFFRAASSLRPILVQIAPVPIAGCMQHVLRQGYVHFDRFVRTNG
jgi:hypothetical protein